ncbi:uncharacterized protein LOC144881610 [Branchiostoma floridae x Branchiostoma japonicum]
MWRTQTICFVAAVLVGFAGADHLQGNATAGLTECERERADSEMMAYFGLHVPQCDEDGNFSTTQCWASLGHCFCANPHDGEWYGDTATESEHGEGMEYDCDTYWQTQHQPGKFTQGANCHFGYTLSDDYCFKVYQMEETWSRANTTCVNFGGFLAAPKTQDLNDKILNLLEDDSDGHYWIGLAKSDDGLWHWTDGTAAVFTAWGRGEPNNSDGREGCVELRTGGRGWNDVPCGSKFHFVCQTEKGAKSKCQEEEEAQDDMLFNDDDDDDDEIWVFCEEDGSYSTQQCDFADRCYCAHPWSGTIYRDTEHNFWEHFFDLQHHDCDLYWQDKNEEAQRWRDDLRCGEGYPAPGADAAECDPDGPDPCCSGNQFCGNTDLHCSCPDCIDYRLPKDQGENFDCVEGDGSSYRGTLAKTKSGRTCQRWDSQYPHSHARNTPLFNPELEENYCRNPIGRTTIWCYTTDPEKRWELCDLPDCDSIDHGTDGKDPISPEDDCQVGDGSSYRGTAATTKSGQTCQPWSEYGWYDDLDENYCRNPDGEVGVWCYTEGLPLWELCDVPVCDAGTGDVRVSQCAGSTTNIARGHEATQSSQFEQAGPERAVDGNVDAMWTGNSCTHTTDWDDQPWWRVDLGASKCVDRVVVTNRKDCCSERLDGFRVYVGDDPNVAANPSCGDGQEAAGRVTIPVDCGGLTGRYVGITLPRYGWQPLTLCEVQVFGDDCLTRVTGTDLSYRWDLPPLTSSPFPFEVKASSDVHIVLSNQNYPVDNMYEIVIGDSRSVIRRHEQGDAVAAAATPDILSPDIYRGFLISWSADGTISVRRETEDAPFLTWKDPNPLPIAHVGYSTGSSSNGTFLFCPHQGVNGETGECMEGDGESYRGTVAHTTTGLECQRWDSHSPHVHYAYTPFWYPNAGLDENYCRNPDGNDIGPWCFTTDPDVRWQLCDVPTCVAATTTPPSLCETATTDGSGKYSWDLPPLVTSPFPFEVRAKSGVYIALATTDSADSRMYEVLIGGESDTMTAIRRGRQGDWAARVDMTDILSPEEYRGFWISWMQNGTIAVGKEGETAPLLQWTDPNPLPVEHVGYSTRPGVSGDFRFCGYYESKRWREDARCGADFPAPGANPGECNPKGPHPCCSEQGWCGETPQYCSCEGCVDYRHLEALERKDCQVGDGSTYRGDVAVTHSGRVCQEWDAWEPHFTWYGSFWYPESGLDKNYCRNPDGQSGVWCYTMDPDKEMELCDVPKCGDVSDKEAELGVPIQTSQVCEYERMTLECSTNQHIAVAHALFGRTETEPHCGGDSWYFGNTNCRSINAVSVVKDQCDGRRTCTVTADHAVFGDPCFGTSKYLEVKYGCLENDSSQKGRRQCLVRPAMRKDCGWSGITREECLLKGCCFNSSVPGVASCFYKKVSPSAESPTAKQDDHTPTVTHGISKTPMNNMKTADATVSMTTNVPPVVNSKGALEGSKDKDDDDSTKPGDDSHQYAIYIIIGIVVVAVPLGIAAFVKVFFCSKPVDKMAAPAPVHFTSGSGDATITFDNPHYEEKTPSAPGYVPMKE